MTVQTKEFPTRDVLGIVTGRLLGDIGGIYEVLNWMTGESLFTHQLPRVGEEALPAILSVHPHLSEAIAEAEQVTAENWQEWRQAWEDRFGPSIAVPKLNADEHERIITNIDNAHPIVRKIRAALSPAGFVAEKDMRDDVAAQSGELKPLRPRSR